MFLLKIVSIKHVFKANEDGVAASFDIFLIKEEVDGRFR
jgi:hypothetical protein